MIGPRIKAYRESIGMTRRRLAKLADLNEHTLYDLEFGRFEPRMSSLLLICHALGCTPNDLILEEDYA